MKYAEAQRKAVVLAEQGDLAGLNRLIKEAEKAGIDQMLIYTLATFREKAVMNLNAKGQSGKR